MLITQPPQFVIEQFFQFIRRAMDGLLHVFHLVGRGDGLHSFQPRFHEAMFISAALFDCSRR